MASFRGNCSGLLIHDLLSFYRPRSVFDPMTGGGTCRDVCRSLGIPCVSSDLEDGHDAADPNGIRNTQRFEFIWLHPPYWNLIRYSTDPRCLSNAPNVAAFLGRIRQVFGNCRNVLAPGGRMAVLMGDIRRHGEYFGLPMRVFYAAVAEGFWLDAPEIIRASHGATSSAKRYAHAFIPRLHDVCFVMRQAKPPAS